MLDHNCSRLRATFLLVTDAFLASQAYKSEIHVDKYLGVPIELIDRAVYEGGENLQMHPSDDALLRDPVANKRK